MNDIRGFMLPADSAAIYNICSKFKDSEYVFVYEIGTLYGKSAVTFDDALKGVEHHIVTVDVCEGWQGPTEEMIEELGLDDNFKEEVIRNRSTPQEQFEEIHKNILNRDITFMVHRWSKWDTPPDRSPNIVFYDGSHSYEETKDVLDYWSKCMRSGGVIAIDDYNCGQWHDLKRAVDEFCEQNNYEITSYQDSKIVSITL